MTLRGHQPIVIDQFNGLWQRGDPENTPLDHFSESNNIRLIGTNKIGSRWGVGIHQDVQVPLSNVKRFYNYPTPTGNTLIVLTMDSADTVGKIYHVVNAQTVYGPILTKTGMTDFAFIPYAGRAYISPFTSYLMGDLNIEKGLQNEFLYVYMGDGTAARKAAGDAVSGSLTIANGAAGATDPGFHLFGVVYETSSGYLTPPGVISSFTTAQNLSVSFTGIPTSASPTVIKRHLVATKVITGYAGNTTGYTFYFIPDGTIDDNVTTFLSNVSFFDSGLLDDASHLLDNYGEIPAGASLWFYRNRLHLGATYNDISLVLVSEPGEPEAINQITGLIIVPLDGDPITAGSELRDVDYIFKRSKTFAYVDNDDVPSSWPMTTVDNALGCPVHGIATVLTTGSASVDSLIIATYLGILLFNGIYVKPELSWKIADLWIKQDRDEFRKIQMVNNVTLQEILVVIPDGRLLIANYSKGMTAKHLFWTPYGFARNINTVALVNIDEVILGMDLL